MVATAIHAAKAVGMGTSRGIASALAGTGSLARVAPCHAVWNRAHIAPAADAAAWYRVLARAPEATAPRTSESADAVHVLVQIALLRVSS